jgi:SHAQKYF class myb-like DNA-binding protein
MFLVGLEKMGKGDWRGISKNFVPTRTPTQVASHAQKYFLRLTTINNKKRRSSLFDLVGIHIQLTHQLLTCSYVTKYKLNGLKS